MTGGIILPRAWPGVDMTGRGRGSAGGGADLDGLGFSFKNLKGKMDVKGW